MNWLVKLLGLKPRANWRQVNWSEITAGWLTVEALAAGSPSQVKEALIKADSLLDQLLKQAGVAGQTFGERLKGLKETLPRPLYRSLWQAHLKRNELVHEPTSQIQSWEKTEYLAGFQEAIAYFHRQ